MKKQVKATLSRRWFLMLALFVTSTPMFAVGGASPYSSFITALSTEASSIWANGIAIIGLVVGLAGCMFGSHHIKQWATTAVVICVALLGVNAIVAWL